MPKTNDPPDVTTHPCRWLDWWNEQPGHSFKLNSGHMVYIELWRYAERVVRTGMFSTHAAIITAAQELEDVDDE